MILSFVFLRLQGPEPKKDQGKKKLRMLLSLVWFKTHGPQNLKSRVIPLILTLLVNMLVPETTAAIKAQKIQISMPQYEDLFSIPL